jgi:hypothetical protein
MTNSNAGQAPQFLLMTTDRSNAFSLGGAPPVPPLLPGETATLEYQVQHGPVRFVSLQIGPDDRFSSLGPQGIVPQGGPMGDWRLDELAIDGIVQSLLHPSSIDLLAGWRIGRVVRMRVTNIGFVPSHFYATWEVRAAELDEIDAMEDAMDRVTEEDARVR